MEVEDASLARRYSAWLVSAIRPSGYYSMIYGTFNWKAGADALYPLCRQSDSAIRTLPNGHIRRPSDTSSVIVELSRKSLYRSKLKARV